MIEQGRQLHLLRDGELIDAVIRTIPTGPTPICEGCGIELSYLGCRLRAYGLDNFEAWSALRGALAIDGIVLNIPAPRASALA